jgi:hypothetical protein
VKEAVVEEDSGGETEVLAEDVPVEKDEFGRREGDIE